MPTFENLTKKETITASTGHSFPPGAKVEVSNATAARILNEPLIQTALKTGRLEQVTSLSEDEDQPFEYNREWLASATNKNLKGFLTDPDLCNMTASEIKGMNTDELRDLVESWLFPVEEPPVAEVKEDQ